MHMIFKSFGIAYLGELTYVDENEWSETLLHSVIHL